MTEEEYDLCEKMSKEDIQNYAEMASCLDVDRDAQAGEMKRYLSKYGKDVKEIQENIERHLNECWLCRDYFKEEYISSLMMHVIGDLSADKNPKIKASRKRARLWRLEHAAHPDPEGLDTYLRRRARAEVDKEKFGYNQDFEEHLKNCNSCQEVYKDKLEDMLSAADIRKKNRGNE